MASIGYGNASEKSFSTMAMWGIFLEIVFSIENGIQTQILNADSDSATSNHYEKIQNQLISYFLNFLKIFRI